MDDLSSILHILCYLKCHIICKACDAVVQAKWMIKKKLMSADSSPSVFRSHEKYKYSVEWSIIRNSTDWNRFKQDPSIASNPNANIFGQILVLWIEHMKREEKTSLFDGKKIFIIYVITVRWKMLLSIHWYSTVHPALCMLLFSSHHLQTIR